MAALVIASVAAGATAVGVVVLFVWAARKDGQDQEARDRQRGFHRHWP
jgi:hypothetical protein